MPNPWRSSVETGKFKSFFRSINFKPSGNKILSKAIWTYSPLSLASLLCRQKNALTKANNGRKSTFTRQSSGRKSWVPTYSIYLPKLCQRMDKTSKIVVLTHSSHQNTRRSSMSGRQQKQRVSPKNCKQLQARLCGWNQTIRLSSHSWAPNYWFVQMTVALRTLWKLKPFLRCGRGYSTNTWERQGTSQI
jgi:hypothetical protein